MTPARGALARAQRPAWVSAEEAETIAREAIVFAYPMLFNYKTIWEQTQDHLSSSFIGGLNRYRHYTRSYTSADTDIVTPNNDSPYSWAWFDLRREPVVLRVPKVAEDRYYVVQMFDLFTYNFAYVGVRSTGFDAGDYLIAPSWEGSARRDPRRAAHRDPAGRDADPHRAVRRRRHAQRPSDPAWLRDPAAFRVRRAAATTPVPPPVFPAWDQQRALSADFIGYLNFLLGLIDPHPSEAALYDRCRDRDRRWATMAARENVRRRPRGDRDRRQAWAQRHRQRASHTTSSIGLFGSRDQLGDDYLTRAVAANMGIYGETGRRSRLRRQPTRRQRRAADRRPSAIALHFDQATLPDAKFFWSITLYELPSRLLAANPIDRYSIGDRTPGITYADDGSFTITLQAAAPDRSDRARQLAADPHRRPVHDHLPPLRTWPRRPDRQVDAATDHETLEASCNATADRPPAPQSQPLRDSRHVSTFEQGVLLLLRPTSRPRRRWMPRVHPQLYARCSIRPAYGDRRSSGSHLPRPHSSAHRRSSGRARCQGSDRQADW